MHHVRKEDFRNAVLLTEIFTTLGFVGDVQQHEPRLIDLCGAICEHPAHALAICLFRKGEITLLHAGDEYMLGDDWQKFPAVRDTLVRWNLLERSGPDPVVFGDLGIRVNKVSAVGDPLEASLDYLVDNPTDLLVLATEGREGLPRWVQRSAAENLARADETISFGG